jgi:hypothetical protein
LWTLWVWRRQVAHPGHNPHLSIALLFATVPVAACLSSTPADRALLLGLPAIATLAAFALPTFRRSISALIDWFTLLSLQHPRLPSGWSGWRFRPDSRPRSPPILRASLLNSKQASPGPRSSWR